MHDKKTLFLITGLAREDLRWDQEGFQKVIKEPKRQCRGKVSRAFEYKGLQRRFKASYRHFRKFQGVLETFSGRSERLQGRLIAYQGCFKRFRRFQEHCKRCSKVFSVAIQMDYGDFKGVSMV